MLWLPCSFPCSFPFGPASHSPGELASIVASLLDLQAEERPISYVYLLRVVQSGRDLYQDLAADHLLRPDQPVHLQALVCSQMQLALLVINP
jgi:hypothetical protein